MTDRRFLGLTHNPFMGRQSGFFESGDRKACLDQLRHLSQWSRQVLVVSGPMGIGKTTIFRELSGSLDARVSGARLNGTLVSAGREVLLAVAVNFGISTPADAFTDELIDIISQHVETRDKDGRFCVVLVDDAHLLDPGAIDSLLHLAAISQLRIILFGQDNLINSLSRSTGGNAAQELRLEPFKKVEVREYIEWRFAQAHYRGRSPLTEQQIEAITRASGGLPGKINALVNEHLSLLAGGSAGRGRKRLPDLHRGLITLIVLVTALLYLIVQPQFGGNEDATDAGTGEIVRAEDNTWPVEDPDDSDALELLDELADPDQQPVQLPDGEVVKIESTTLETDTAVETEVVADFLDRESDQAVQPATSAPAVLPVVAEVSPGLVQKTGADKPASSNSGQRRDAAWLLQQDPDKFTLQIVTLSSGSSARAFVDRQRNPSQFAICEFKTGGRTLFIVVYGLFDTSDAADRAADNLPKEVGNIKPWKRRVSQLQASIKAN